MKDLIIKPFTSNDYPLLKAIETFAATRNAALNAQQEWSFNENPKPERPRTIQPYFPSRRAKEVVELAQILSRPILLQGEPGSGKTRLAEAVAYDLYRDKYRHKYFEWHIKSTAKAQDGLYTFDHVARLRDANIKDDSVNPNDVARYLKLGPLGAAFLASTEEEPAVLLIDEIDKADIDFPNDLLLELDEKRFRIAEPGIDKTFQAARSPIIFITSNSEKGLPTAFLRRCLYLFFQFPSDMRIRQILAARYQNLAMRPDLVDNMLKDFIGMRDKMEKDPAINRKVSTSEFLDWAEAIERRLKKPKDSDVLPLTLDRLTFVSALYKTTDELKLFQQFDNNED